MALQPTKISASDRATTWWPGSGDDEARGGSAAQTRRYQAAGISEGVPILGKAAAGGAIWQNNLATLRLCLMNLDEVIKQIKT